MTIEIGTRGAISPASGTEGRVKPTAPRFVVVDSLRGVAAFWVVLCHAITARHADAVSSRLPDWLVDLLSTGQIPVSIFFVLSGFVIAYSVSRYEVDARFVGKFALRRSIRLDPPYWASIVLTIGFAYLSHLFVAGKRYSIPGLDVLAAHMVYLQTILRYPEINPAYWTLPLEVQFYLVFCLLLFVAHRFRTDAADRRSTYAIFIPAMLLSAAWPLHLGLGEPYRGSFLSSWYGFLVGMAGCWAMLGTIRPWVFHAYLGVLLVGVIRHPDVNVITCIATAFFLHLAATMGKLSSWLNWPWLLLLGQISYSLYLIHNPITGAFYRVAYSLTGRGLAFQVLWFVPMLLCNVVLAYGFWWLFERTSMAFCHRIRMNKPTKAEPPEIEPPSTRA